MDVIYTSLYVGDVFQVHYNIAKLVGDMGETELAIEKYRLAIKWVKS